MKLQQRRLKKNCNCINCTPFTRNNSLLNFDLLKGDISLYASFLQLLNFSPFLMQIVHSVIL